MKKYVLWFLLGFIMTVGLIGCSQNPTGEVGTEISRQSYPVIQEVMDNAVEDSLALIGIYSTRSGYDDPRLNTLESALLSIHSSSRQNRSIDGDFFDNITEEQDLEIEALLEENPELLDDFIVIVENLEEEVANLPDIEVKVQDYDEAGNLIGEPYTITSENGLLDLGMDAISVAEYVKQAQNLTGESIRGFAAQYGYNRTRYWRNNTVEFFFDNSLSSADKEWMRIRLAAITKATGIKFKELKNTGWRRFRHSAGAQWLKVRKKDLSNAAGSATIGQRSWAVLTMDVDWVRYQPTFEHEVGHVLGLVHEHQRPDRDGYVVVKTPNGISSSSRKTNWDKIPYTRVTSWRQVWQRTVRVSTNYGTPFDYASVMSYQDLTIKQNPYYTTNQMANKMRWGSSNGGTYYTPWDIYIVKRMYGISVTAPNYTPNPNPWQ